MSAKPIGSVKVWNVRTGGWRQFPFVMLGKIDVRPDEYVEWIQTERPIRLMALENGYLMPMAVLPAAPSAMRFDPLSVMRPMYVRSART